MRIKILSKKWLIAFLLIIGQSIPYYALAQKEESDNQFKDNLNKPEREAWLQDQGFGMFIHFNYDALLGITISHSLVGASKDYVDRYFKDLPQLFDPEKFDAYKIAKLAKLCGMKYIVFTTKHHSGFCFWDTKTTDLKITNTEYKKDLLKEYVEGVRKAGLAVGFYYSPEDFKFLYDRNILIKRGDMKFDKKTTEDYDDLVRRQTTELFSNYGKIDILFIDGSPKDPCKYTAWKLQPDLVITRGAINTPEQTVPGAILDKFWESNVTIGTGWNYKPTNDNIKTGGKIIELLVETRAKGGNLLLNISPHPDGYVPYEQETQLREVAAWTFINHEAIESVRPWIVPREENIWYTTTKDKKAIFAILTKIPLWPFAERKEFILKSVKATAETKISVLGQNDLVAEYQKNDPKSTFKQEADGLHVSVVRAQRIYDNYKWPNPLTIKLENVEPALVPPVVITLKFNSEANSVNLKGNLVNKGDVNEVQVGFEYQPYGGFAENLYNNTWKKTKLVKVDKTGEFTVSLEGLEKGKEYQYRAIAAHPKMTINGNVMIFKMQ